MAVFLNKCHLTACSSAEVACIAGGIVWVRLKFWPRSRVPKKGSRDEAVEILRRSWRLRHQISLDYITMAPPPNLTRLLHNTASYAGYSWSTFSTTIFRSAIFFSTALAILCRDPLIIMLLLCQLSIPCEKFCLDMLCTVRCTLASIISVMVL